MRKTNVAGSSNCLAWMTTNTGPEVKPTGSLVEDSFRPDFFLFFWLEQLVTQEKQDCLSN